ncbi:MAG: diguanylate cyclase, partial [Sulfurimonas sp.]|nr:diguanylate cyclase [Sulfurimonas sp.]
LIAERLLSLISSNKLIYMGQKISVTVSIGATKLLKDDIPDSLLSRADKALYFSKHNGKNQVSTVME